MSSGFLVQKEELRLRQKLKEAEEVHSFGFSLFEWRNSGKGGCNKPIVLKPTVVSLKILLEIYFRFLCLHYPLHQ